MKINNYENEPMAVDASPESIDLSIIPVNSNKIPIGKWKFFQSEIAPVSQWQAHLRKNNNVGVICGNVSHNLECIDIDVKNDPFKTIWDEYRNLIGTELLSKLIIQTTPNAGYHLIYRCEDAKIEPNLGLAFHTDGNVIIETRGEGGYFCTGGNNYTVIQGALNLHELNVEVPLITGAEREKLLEMARSLNRKLDVSKSSKGSKDPAINQFNEEFDLIPVLEKHGWSTVKEDDQKVFVLREGSLASHSGYYYKESHLFVCFTTSTEFVPGKPYNNFQALQILEGNNDYRTTLRLMSGFGYESEGKQKRIGAHEVAEYLNNRGVRYDNFIQEIIFTGQTLDERTFNTLFIDINNDLGNVPRIQFESVLKSRYIVEVDPVKEYIDANKHRRPTGVIDQWVSCLKLKNPNVDIAVITHLVRKWYVGIIAQALDGGFPNEFFLSIVSVEQGIGKSTFLREYTLPKELRKYVCEQSLIFDADFKVLMGQAILIIDDEMDSRTYELNKTFKNVLSVKNNTVRRKFDRRHSTIKRRCSFAGSGNNLNVVRERENRRIIPIEIADVDRDKLALVDLNDLFMEAYCLFAEGFQYSYQPGDREYLNQLNVEYIQHSELDVIIDNVIDRPKSEEDEYDITIIDLKNTLVRLYPNFTHRVTTVSIGKALSERGFSHYRATRKKITTYRISRQSPIVAELKLNTGDEIYL